MATGGSDISEVSGLYSQLAGTLAGFALTAIILILTFRMDRDARASDAFVPGTRVLTVAFIGLVLSAVNYATLAGDQAVSERTALIQVIHGLAFAISGIALMYAITLTFDGANAASQADSEGDLARVAGFVRTVMGAIVTPFLLFLVYLGFQDFETTQLNHNEPPGQCPCVAGVSSELNITYYDWVCWALIAVQTAAGAFYLIRRTHIQAGSGRENSNLTASIGLGLILTLSIIGHVVSAFTTEMSSLHTWMPFVVVCIGSVAGVTFVVYLSRSRITEERTEVSQFGCDGYL